MKLDQTFSYLGDAVAWGRSGEGPPLVLVHGTPFSSQVWRRLVPYLSRRWTVYAFDLLGYGQSTMRAGQDVSLGVQNGLLAALFAEWGLQKPDVLAHDFGGATVLRGYYLNGLRYNRLTLVDPVAIAPWGSPFVTHLRQHEAAFAGMPDYAHRALLDAYLQGASFRGLDREALQVHSAPWCGPVGQSAFYRQIAQMDQAFTDVVEPIYGVMECDVTLLWGEQDAWIPLATGQRLAELLKVARFLPVPDAGHLVQEDAPEAILAAMFE